MPTKAAKPNGRIRLVDDDPGLLRLLSIRLRAETYEVEAVESAEQALAKLSRFSPDLVITQSVTNTGSSTVNLTAYVSAPGLSRQRRSIGGLQRGQTATRTFRLPDGAALLAGRQVRIGIVTQEEAGEDIVPGTIKSAPKKPMLRMKAAGTTFVAALVWGVIYYLIDTA